MLGHLDHVSTREAIVACVTRIAIRVCPVSVIDEHSLPTWEPINSFD